MDNYEDVCRHIGHMYLSSQFQIQKKEKEALELVLQNQDLRNQIKDLQKALAAKETVDEPRPQGTSG
jgi:cell division protein FtsB